MEENIKLYDYLEDTKQIAKALIRKRQLKTKIKFILDVSHKIKSIYTDKIKLSQIIYNLLSNAIKFTKSGHITLRVFPESDVSALNRSKVHPIQFQLIDTGEGVPDELREIIDKEETYNNVSGNGFGFKIVHNLCLIIGSKIKYEKNDPHGSKFSFVINNGKLKFSSKFDSDYNITSIIKPLERIHNVLESAKSNSNS